MMDAFVKKIAAIIIGTFPPEKQTAPRHTGIR
jgi:hypothetical protein